MKMVQYEEEGKLPDTGKNDQCSSDYILDARIGWENAVSVCVRGWEDVSVIVLKPVEKEPPQAKMMQKWSQK